jgi:DNA-damage-inducible protein J
MSNLTLTVDDQVKREVDALYKSLGMNMSTAVNIFFRKSLQVGGIPFPVTAPQRGVVVKSDAVYEPKIGSTGAAMLPADWDDAEDEVYDALYA